MKDAVLVLGASRSGVGVVAEAVTGGLRSSLLNRSCADRLAPGGAMPTGVVVAADDHENVPHLREADRLLCEHSQLRAIVVWRGAVEFVNSRLRTRRDADFISHCRLWSAAIERLEKLADRFGSRVLLIEQHRLRQRASEVASELAVFLGAEFSTNDAANILRNSQPGRSCAINGVQVAEPAFTSWSMGEVEVFAGICGERAGIDEDALVSAERLRTIDLARLLDFEAETYGGTHIHSRHGRKPVRVTFDARRTMRNERPLVRLPNISAGSRQHLTLRVAVEITEGTPELQCSIVESQSRRPLFVMPIGCDTNGRVYTEYFMPEHTGMLDFSIEFLPPASGRCGIAIETARISKD